MRSLFAFATILLAACYPEPTSGVGTALGGTVDPDDRVADDGSHTHGGGLRGTSFGQVDLMYVTSDKVDDFNSMTDLESSSGGSADPEDDDPPEEDDDSPEEDDDAPEGDDIIGPDDDEIAPSDTTEFAGYHTLESLEGPFELSLSELSDLIPVDQSETEQSSDDNDISLLKDPNGENAELPMLGRKYGPYVFKNYYNKKALYSTSSHRVRTARYSGSSYQKWYLYTTSYSHVYYVQNARTGRVLSSNRSGQVYTYSYNGGNYQKWKFYKIGHYWVIQNVYSKKVLQAYSNGHVQGQYYKKYSSQFWY